MSSPARVLVVGDANPDLVLRGDVVPRFGQAEQLLEAADLVLGGSAAIAACGLARLGVPVALAAVVGDDLFGHETLRLLGEAGVDVSTVTTRVGEATGLSVHLAVPGDRAILTLPGTIPAIDADAVRAAVRTVAPQRVHVASPYLTPAITAGLPGLLREWRAAGIGTSLDPNWDPAGEWSALAEALPLVDVLLPNAAELGELSRVSDTRVLQHGAAGQGVPVARHGAAELESRPHLVVKAGADGGWSLSPDGVRTEASGLPLETIVDTTGAGDTFDAGYLAALAHGVADESERLRWAAVAGSLSTRAAGGTAGQPTLDELRAALG
ncbi:MAG: carbohydrate kinase family protein [Schumannella sp.]|nr:carbohydrate kinase family protein [Microbacteriaceae bacterium]